MNRPFLTVTALAVGLTATIARPQDKAIESSSAHLIRFAADGTVASSQTSADGTPRPWLELQAVVMDEPVIVPSK